MMKIPPPAPGLDDGLYAVSGETWRAGFVVKDGRVVKCAPMLRRGLPEWITKARRVEGPDRWPLP